MEDIITYRNTRGGNQGHRAPGHPATYIVIASTHSKWRAVGDILASIPPHTKHIASTT